MYVVFERMVKEDHHKKVRVIKSKKRSLSVHRFCMKTWKAPASNVLTS